MNKLLIASIFLVLIALGGFGYQYYDSQDEVKCCDSINIKSDYNGEPICYESSQCYPTTKFSIFKK